MLKNILKILRIKDELIRHSGIMIIATGIVNIFNLLFHLFMIRNLSTIDYGILNSLLAIFMIVSVPAQTVQTVFAKFVSHYHAGFRIEYIKFFIRHLGKKICIIAGVFFIFFFSLSKYLAHFLQLPDTRILILLGATLSLFIILPVFWGGLQGVQKFIYLGRNMVIGTGLKLLFGITAVILGLSVMGIMGGLFFACIVQLVISFTSLRSSLKTCIIGSNNACVKELQMIEIYKYFFPVALANFCFMALINGDILLVKHFFSPYSAGQYSVASMAGKIMIFLPAAISIVMFPMTSKLYAENRTSKYIFNRSLLYSGVLCGCLGLGFIMYPNILIRLFSVKDQYPFIVLSRLFVIAMGFHALNQIIMYYNLSVHNLSFLFTFILSLIVQIVLICFFHNTLTQIVFILAINGMTLFFVNILMVKLLKEDN